MPSVASHCHRMVQILNLPFLLLNAVAERNLPNGPHDKILALLAELPAYEATFEDKDVPGKIKCNV